MKICFAITPDSTGEKRLADHFGDSPCFVTYDTQTGTYAPHPCHRTPCRGPCQCHLPSLTPGAFDAVICRSIGARALAAMRRQQIDIYLTQALNAREALDGWRRQTLRPAVKGACRPEQVRLRAQARQKGRG